MSSRLLKASHVKKTMGGNPEGKTGLHQNQPAFRKPADDKIPQKDELEAGGQSHERQGSRGKTGEQNMEIIGGKTLL